MLNKILRSMTNDSGAADAKVGTYILIIVIIISAYFAYIYGPAYYKDFMFKKDLEVNLKYDTFKIHSKPSTDAMRDKYLQLARGYDITFPEEDTGDEYIHVFESGKWFSVEYRYKKIIKPLIGKPKSKWFADKIYPSK